MAKRPKSSRRKPAGGWQPQPELAVETQSRWEWAVWAGIAAYLVAFYLTPIAGAVLPSGEPLRRLDVLGSLVELDRTIADWFEGATWQAIAQRGQMLIATAIIAAFAWLAGWSALRLAGLDRRLDPLESFGFATGAGLNLVSLLVLGLGLAGQLDRGALLCVAAGITAMAVLAWRLPTRSSTSDLRPKANSLKPLLLAAAPFVLFLLLAAMLPPIDFDVREYHLQAPKEFYQQGRITFLPHNVYANMPLGTEMLSLAGMIVMGDWWSGALVGKTLIALYAPLTAVLLLAAGRRLDSPVTGIVAALLYLSTPWIALVSIQGLVEGAFAYYLFAALYATVLATNALWSGGVEPSRESHGNRVLALAGFLAGGAVSTKYPAVLFCVAPLAAWIGYARWTAHDNRPALRRILAPFAVFTLFVALGCGPWLVKNAVLTGNPVYPLAYDLFDGATRTPDKDAQWRRAHAPPNYSQVDLARRALGFLLTSPWLCPLVVPLAALAALGRRRRFAIWLWNYVGFVLLTWWLFTHRLDRFWVPILPVMSLLAGLGAAWSSARAWRIPLASLLAFVLVSNFVTLTSGVLGDNRYLAEFSQLSADPRRVAPWHLYLNEHRDEVSGVLLIGDAQPFDLDVPTTYNTVFDDNVFEQLARDRSPEQLRQALQVRRLSHVLVDWDEVNRYRSPGNYGFTSYIQPQVFERLVQAGVLAELPKLQESSGQLFRVVPASPKRAGSESDR